MSKKTKQNKIPHKTVTLTIFNWVAAIAIFCKFTEIKKTKIKFFFFFSEQVFVRREYHGQINNNTARA